MKKLVLLTLLVVTALAAKADYADRVLGDGELPPVAPDGTALSLVDDGTARGTLVGGSRYVGWLENSMQGALFDRTTRQSWYIYAQFGEPGSGKETWYARDLPDPMPAWVNDLPLHSKHALDPLDPLYQKVANVHYDGELTAVEIIEQLKDGEAVGSPLNSVTRIAHKMHFVLSLKDGVGTITYDTAGEKIVKPAKLSIGHDGKLLLDLVDPHSSLGTVVGYDVETFFRDFTIEDSYRYIKSGVTKRL